MTEERRESIIEHLLYSAHVHSGGHVTEEQLDRYEAWLLMQTNTALQNKLLINC